MPTTKINGRTHPKLFQGVRLTTAEYEQVKQLRAGEKCPFCFETHLPQASNVWFRHVAICGSRKTRLYRQARSHLV